MDNWISEELNKVAEQINELNERKNRHIESSMRCNFISNCDYTYIYILIMFGVPILLVLVVPFILFILGYSKSEVGLMAVNMLLVSMAVVPVIILLWSLVDLDLTTKKFNEHAVRLDTDNMAYWKDRQYDKLKVYLCWKSDIAYIYDNISVQNNEYEECYSMDSKELEGYVVNKVYNKIKTRSEIERETHALFKQREYRLIKRR